jgi:hypothetical protein
LQFLLLAKNVKYDNNTTSECVASLNIDAALGSNHPNDDVSSSEDDDNVDVMVQATDLETVRFFKWLILLLPQTWKRSCCQRLPLAL